jgi:hypothetical protein
MKITHKHWEGRVDGQQSGAGKNYATTIYYDPEGQGGRMLYKWGAQWNYGRGNGMDYCYRAAGGGWYIEGDSPPTRYPCRLAAYAAARMS